MEKIIKDVDKKRGIVQVTVADERWYSDPVTVDEETGLPERVCRPSATWIANKYPKGQRFWTWLQNVGMTEAEYIKEEAGRHGDLVHQAIALLLNGEEVKLDTPFIDKTTDQEVTLDWEQFRALKSFKQFIDEYEITPDAVLGVEISIINKEFGERGFGGTIDVLVDGDKIEKFPDGIGVLDWKTGNYIWPSHEIQQSLYVKGPIYIGEDEYKAEWSAVVRIDYQRNKHKKYRFDVVDLEKADELAEHAYAIWVNEHLNEEPKKLEIPLQIGLEGFKKSKKSKK